MSYLAALTLTLVIELPAYAGLLRRGLSIPVRQGLAAGAAINLTSHPLAFLVVMPRIAASLGYFPALAVVETGVWILEAGLLCAWLRRDAGLLGLAALLANALSLSIGLLLFI
jgi:hypothetical protein